MDNKTAMTKFSTRLKALRTENSLSQSQVAQKLGISSSTYANWEQGRRGPSIADIYNIIERMNIEANDLFDIN